MNDFKQLGVINGGQFLGKGVTVLADYVDTKYPPADGAILKRKGLWINVGIGILGQIASVYFIKNDNVRLATLVGSSHALTKVVDYAMEAAIPTPAARAALPARPLRVTPRALPRVLQPGAGLGAGLITVD